MTSSPDPRPSRASESIEVAALRQIHQWPLVQRDLSKKPNLGAWTRRPDPLDAISEGEDGKQWSFQEFVYFHDFVQRFLYDDHENGAFQLYSRSDIAGLIVGIEDALHEFSVERLTLHRFVTGAAVVTLETVWKGRKAANGPTSDTPSLNLAEAQTIIDHMRRSYTPYWGRRDDGTLEGGRVPTSFAILGADGSEQSFRVDQNPDDLFDVVRRNRYDDAVVFEHWRRIAGLSLQGGDREPEWRDPSDERIPLLSYIALRQRPDESPRDTMLMVRDHDWIRLADAEEAGDAHPYNPRFLEDVERRAFYDRFFPHEAMPSYLATRHVFGGAHYCVVGVSDPEAKFDFARDLLRRQFRRHYAQMALIARFEHASLLSYSSRMTEAVRRRQIAGGDPSAERDFEDEIAAIRDEFLSFTHRFRFTGVSSQIQGAEMFDRWRDMLRLDTLYADVETELRSSMEHVRAQQEARRADDALRLAGIAEFIAVFGIAVAALSMPAVTDAIERL